MEVTIHNVISVLGLPLPREGQHQYNIPCPSCDTEKNKKHLNINLDKGVFNCPRCGVHGGTLSLYCLFTNIKDTPEGRKEAYKLILDGVGNYSVPQPKYQPKKIHECDLASVEKRNATYNALLNHLGLAESHKKNLLNRGLSEEDIKRLGYKTSPTKNCKELCRILLTEGCVLEGVPGFWKKNGEWTCGDDKRGILIPFRDTRGRIIGIQKRLDDTSDRKFRWISSSGLPYGTKAEGWVHIVGNPDADTVLITEGGMKADIINALSGRTVIAVAGVNSIQRLQNVLEELIKKGKLKKIKTAFDMDFVSNEFVQKAYDNLIDMLKSLKVHYNILVWDSNYKGLDDYLKYKLIDSKKEGK